jgi:hypothetical protein
VIANEDFFGINYFKSSYWFDETSLNWIKYNPKLETPPSNVIIYFWNEKQHFYVTKNPFTFKATCSDLDGLEWDCSE